MKTKTIDIKGFFTALVIVLSWVVCSRAQYFGRNKPGYKQFAYNVVQTPHFEIYHYLDNDSLLRLFSGWAEEWYDMHQNVFKDTFSHKNPVILYSNHADFQQTNTINSLLGTGTGGVTESLKNRVIMPVAFTLSQTDHVFGHELVHAFQYQSILHSDTTDHYSLENIPLWMIEGMAEYFSIGSLDPNTAMWMRDAIINKDFPTLKQLTRDSKYFPYRYGHAFWAMIGKTWGDTIIMPLFKKTALYGLDRAIDSIFGFDSKTMSGLWKSAMEIHYKNYINDSIEQVRGNKIISTKNGGRMNISPSLSPDGQYLTFFSEKDIFTLDLYLADAKTGKIIKKLSSITRNHEIDDFSFLESGGTWSPDSKKFAFVVFSKGRNKLAIVDVEYGKITREIELENVLSFSNPDWSPNGRYIVCSGLVNGVCDLFLHDLETGKTEKLTDDFYANIHPSWSPDGRCIVYSTERINKKNNFKKFGFDIHILDTKTGEKHVLDIFHGADNLNPLYSHDGQNIYFLSNADGFRNLYSYHVVSKKVQRLTGLNTGISGITPYSPALTVADKSGLIAYTHYYNNKYVIYTAERRDFEPTEIDVSIVNYQAGILPPLKHVQCNIVDSSLYGRNVLSNELPDDSIQEVPYRPKFKLDYISNNVGIGVSNSRYNSNNMVGSVSMVFSDIVGNNQLFSVFSLNGEIYDFGGQVSYINQQNRIKWGGSMSHIPYRSGNMFLTSDTINLAGEDVYVNNMILDYIRMFDDNISLFGYYPLSQTRRFEAGISSSWYYYRIDRYHNYFDDFGFKLGMKKEKIPAPKGNNYQRIDMAYVVDNSYFGMTAPMRGHRSRFQVEKYFGVVNYYTALFDYRKYFYIKPLSFAFRFYHYGRYGGNAGKGIVSPLYIGYPWLIRGYENVSFYQDVNNNNVNANSFNLSHLRGSRILTGNTEIRLPLSGPESLALIRSKTFLIDFNLFFDGGLAWNKGDTVGFDWHPLDFNKRVPVYSAGTSLRVNLFGYIVIEPYYAFPFQNGGWQKGVFGINLVPGW